MSEKRLRLILSLVTAGLLVGLAWFEIPGNTFLTRAINDAMHFPFFGILSLLFLGLLSLFFGKANRPRRYYMAFGLVVMVGALHEYSQISGPRDADIWDLARDVAGALTFLGLYMVHDKKINTFGVGRRKKIRLLFYAFAVIMILTISAPSLLWSAAFIYRDRIFPTICDFDSVLGNRFLKTQHAILERTVAPYEGEGKTANRVGKLEFEVAEYPGLAIEEPYPDWSDYLSFEFTVYSEMDTAVKIGVRIEDLHHNNEYTDRFNGAFIISPGKNAISIPVDRIKNGPSTREMDMKNIRAIHVFTRRPGSGFVLYFDDFRLV